MIAHYAESPRLLDKQFKHLLGRSSRRWEVNALIETLESTVTSKVVFYATESETPDFTDRISRHNLPSSVAVVEFILPGIGELHVIYDNCFLKAKRHERYRELSAVLDVAVASGRAFYSTNRAPFTMLKNPEEAYSDLKTVGPIFELTIESRPKYFAMLSIMTECHLQNL